MFYSDVTDALKDILDDREQTPIFPMECEATPPGELNCKHIIHSVCSIFTNGEQGELFFLRESIRNVLLLAHKEL